MQQKFYGDHRDLLKWTVVGRLLEEHAIPRLVYVPYFPENEDHGRVLEAVWNHFRSHDDLEKLVGELGAELIEVDATFSSRERKPYLEAARRTVESASPPRLVLLDPDTGLQPKTAKATHCTIDEVQTIWGVLSPGDVLVIYQHSWRVKDWQKLARKRLAGVLPDGVEVVVECEPEISHDVAMLVARMPASSV